MADDRYISDSQQRVMDLIRTLAGHETKGLAPSQIAALQQCSPSQVTRDLANLKHRGWAEQIASTGRWRLGPEIVQISLRHATALSRAQTELDEVRNRFSRGDMPCAQS